MAKLIIKHIAEQQGFNQSQLQLKAAVTSQLLSRYWKNTTTEIKLEALDKIAKALGVRPGDLIVPDEELAQYEQELEASKIPENTEEAER